MESKIIEAIKDGDVCAVRSFLTFGVDVNWKSSDYKMTMLQLAVRYSQPKIVQCLVDEGADVNLKNRDGKTAIQLICYNLKKNSDAEVILKILITAGVEINSPFRTYSPENILHFAVLNGNLELVKYLIQRGADINARGYQGQLPIHWIFWKNFNSAVLETLLSAGADVNTEDDHGHTPLFSLISTVKNSYKIPNLDASISDIFDLFLKYKANFTLKDKMGLTPLDVAVLITNNKKRTTAIAKAFIQQCGFSVDIECNVNSSGASQSILELASWNNNKPLVKFLVESGASIDILDNNGYTPLAAAVITSHGRSNLSVIKYLLKHNADVNTITNSGLNILDCVESLDRSRSWKIIIEHLAKRKTTGHQLHASIIKTIAENPKYSSCLKYSITELEKLKDHKLSSKHWLSLYNFLVDHKKKLVSYVQNPIVVEELQSINVTIERKYQRYGTEIKERFVKAMINKNVLNRSAVVLSTLLNSRLLCNIGPDHIVIQKILDYCEFKHLKRFCNAFIS